MSGTLADADNFVTLCYCDGELVSYQTATLTALYQYDLTLSAARRLRHADQRPFGRQQFRPLRSERPVAVPLSLSAKLRRPDDLHQAAGLQHLRAELAGPVGADRRHLRVDRRRRGRDGDGADPVSSACRRRHSRSPAIPSARRCRSRRNLAGSSCTAGTAATAAQIFDIAKNGTNYATLSFAAGGAVAAFAGPGAELHLRRRADDHAARHRRDAGEHLRLSRRHFIAAHRVRSPGGSRGPLRATADKSARRLPACAGTALRKLGTA